MSKTSPKCKPRFCWAAKYHDLDDCFLGEARGGPPDLFIDSREYQGLQANIPVYVIDARYYKPQKRAKPVPASQFTNRRKKRKP
jgi:hypothetical protein